jgi:hypothetical protein
MCAPLYQVLEVASKEGGEPLNRYSVAFMSQTLEKGTILCCSVFTKFPCGVCVVFLVCLFPVCVAAESASRAVSSPFSRTAVPLPNLSHLPTSPPSTPHRHNSLPVSCCPHGVSGRAADVVAMFVKYGVPCIPAHHGLFSTLVAQLLGGTFGTVTPDSVLLDAREVLYRATALAKRYGLRARNSALETRVKCDGVISVGSVSGFMVRFVVEDVRAHLLVQR